MSLLAIDPSIRSSGVALFEGGCLRASNVIKLSTRGDAGARCMRMANEILIWTASHELECPRTLVLEWPQIYRSVKSKGDPNDLIGLAGVSMAVAGLLHYSLMSNDEKVLEIKTFKPSEWIGQTPKSARVERLRGRFSEKELHIFNSTRSSHDAVDAMGIGMFSLGRFDRRRIFSGAL